MSNKAAEVSINIGKRLVSERKRLVIKQTDLIKDVGITRRTQIQYEYGRSNPDALYLATLHNLGLDVMYILIGVRSHAAMSQEHQRLIEAYEAAPEILRDAALVVLHSAD